MPVGEFVRLPYRTRVGVGVLGSSGLDGLGVRLECT